MHFQKKPWTCNFVSPVRHPVLLLNSLGFQSTSLFGDSCYFTSHKLLLVPLYFTTKQSLGNDLLLSNSTAQGDSFQTDSRMRARTTFLKARSGFINPALAELHSDEQWTMKVTLLSMAFKVFCDLTLIYIFDSLYALIRLDCLGGQCSWHRVTFF